MNIEYEARLYPINIEQIRSLLKKHNAICTHPDRLMRRRIFAFPPALQDPHIDKWARVRDEGDKITLSIKYINEKSIAGAKEVEITVPSFQTGCTLLEAAGLVRAKLQENRRETWSVYDCQITIDQWPGLDPLIEIESTTEKSVRNACTLLQFNPKDIIYENIIDLYLKKYGLTREQFNNIQALTFDNALQVLCC